MNPPLSFKADDNGGLLVTGFEDGVVRLLELYNPQKLVTSSGFRHREQATLHLKQAFKPHNGPVTAVAYEQNGTILATGVRKISGDQPFFSFFLICLIRTLKSGSTLHTAVDSSGFP